jgi:magnesium transporter
MEIFIYRHGSPKVEFTDSVESMKEALLDYQNFVWIDMEAPTVEEEEEILAGVFNFHPLTIEDSRRDHPQPKVEEFPEYLYIVFHGVRTDTSSRNFVTKELDVYLGKNFLVTYHHEHFRSIAAIKKQVLASPVACQRGGAYLLHQILDYIVDLYAPVIEDFEVYITKLEDRIFRLRKANNRILAEIIKLKRNVLRLRRISQKQLDIIYRLSHGEFGLIEENMLPFYRDVYDHLLRVSDLSESYRDLVSSLMDTYLSVLSNRTNEVMKTLTIFSAIMLPLSLIAGIYGMNFENMPELKTRFGYFAVLGFMGLVAAIMLGYFWRQGWIGGNSIDEDGKKKSDKDDVNITLTD